MTTPIRNDNSPTINQDRGLKARSQEHGTRPGGPGSTQQAAGARPPAPSVEPDVARAAHLYTSQSDAGAVSDSAVNNAEEAKSLVERLREMMRNNPEGALAAVGGASRQQAEALLGQAPG